MLIFVLIYAVGMVVARALYTGFVASEDSEFADRVGELVFIFWWPLTITAWLGSRVWAWWLRNRA